MIIDISLVLISLSLTYQARYSLGFQDGGGVIEVAVVVAVVFWYFYVIWQWCSSALRASYAHEQHVLMV